MTPGESPPQRRAPAARLPARRMDLTGMPDMGAVRDTCTGHYSRGTRPGASGAGGAGRRRRGGQRGGGRMGQGRGGRRYRRDAGHDPPGVPQPGPASGRPARGPLTAAIRLGRDGTGRAGPARQRRLVDSWRAGALGHDPGQVPAAAPRFTAYPRVTWAGSAGGAPVERAAGVSPLNHDRRVELVRVDFSDHVA